MPMYRHVLGQLDLLLILFNNKGKWMAESYLVVEELPAIFVVDLHHRMCLHYLLAADESDYQHLRIQTPGQPIDSALETGLNLRNFRTIRMTSSKRILARCNRKLGYGVDLYRHYLEVPEMLLLPGQCWIWMNTTYVV